MAIRRETFGRVPCLRGEDQTWSGGVPVVWRDSGSREGRAVRVGGAGERWKQRSSAGEEVRHERVSRTTMQLAHITLCMFSAKTL